MAPLEIGFQMLAIRCADEEKERTIGSRFAAMQAADLSLAMLPF